MRDMLFSVAAAAAAFAATVIMRPARRRAARRVLASRGLPLSAALREPEHADGLGRLATAVHAGRSPRGARKVGSR